MPDPIGRVKACTECRQQKIRCDAYKDYSQPCSRCRSSHLPCIISKDFQRRPKQSKAQLQHELDLLKASTGGNRSPGDNTTVRGEDEVPVEPSQKKRRRETTSPARGSRTVQPASADPEPSPSLRDMLQKALTPGTDAVESMAGNTAKYQNGDIGDLVLDGILVESQKIKDCYSRFLEHYSPHLEGLCDRSLTMEKRYQFSPLLFWTMVCVGSRGYPKDSSLYARLGPAVLKQIFGSLISPPNPLPVLQAAIILCSWPLPVELIYKEPCQALAGAATNIAVQNGLHMYTREQDFIIKYYEKADAERPLRVATDDPIRARHRIRDEAVIARTRVWVHCLIVFQNTYICDGLPPTGLTPCFRRSEIYGEIIKLLPDMQGYRLRLHRLQIEAINMIASSCDIESDKQDTVLNAMITSYDDRIRDVAMPQVDSFHLFIRNCVSVSVLGLIWVIQQEPSHYHALRLYKTAQEVISLAETLDREIHDFTFYMPHFFIRMLLYCGHVVLRVHKSPLGEKLGENDAERALGIVVPIIKRRAAQTIDILAINAAVLQQLWTSKKAFVHDGKPQNGLRVDVRYRLLLNPVSDDVWWWRKEFGPSPLMTEDLARCNDKNVGVAALQDENGNTTAEQPGQTPAATFDDSLLNFDYVFQDFQDWWAWSGMATDDLDTEPRINGNGTLPGDGPIPI